MNKERDNLPAVLGIGNALVDIMVSIENDSILEDFKLPRGSMTLVGAGKSEEIYEATLVQQKSVTTGGSAANTIHALAGLGGNCGYLGKIGKDELGSIFKEEFEKRSINTHLSISNKGTGRVMALVSHDSERTMATFLGAAVDLDATDLDETVFVDYEYLYIEGYLVQNHKLIETAIKMAKSNNLKIAIDLSSYNVVEENLEFLKVLIRDFVDIVFANEEEALAFTGQQPEAALKILSEQCRLAIVKIGKEGSLIKEGDKEIRIDPIKAQAIDTTGAGDSYAAGFLYGLANNLSLEQCGKIAALVSGKVVEVMGAKLPENIWGELNRQIKDLCGH